MKKICTCLILCAVLGWATPARADVVTYWNDVAEQALLLATPARPGPTALLDYATVHVAIHDAIQAIQGRFELYTGEIANGSGSPIAAASTAARDVLISRLPGSAADAFVETKYQEFLAANGLTTADAGVIVGQQAAAQIIEARANDGSFPNPAPTFFGGTNPGDWRPTVFSGTPPVAQSMVAPWLGGVLPFTLKDPAQFLASPPPAHLRSGEYVKAYDEVKSLGVKLGGTALTPDMRTPEQLDTAFFFADNSVTYWQRALRSIATTYLVDIGESARMFALVEMAMADAVITAWNTKLHYNFWRPQTAIQLGDSDGNSRTAGDPDWLPLIPTPNYPDYTSGANSLSGAATTMLANFFGTDKMTFSLTSAFVPPAGYTFVTTRTYDRFSDAADDVVDARVYEGIHFRFADTVARREGKHVANWAFAHFLRPLQ
jgi:hypothetical protein